MTDNELKLRSWETELEVRSDGRTLEGLCVPFDVEQEIPAEGIREVFRRGAFLAQTRAPWRLGLFDGHHEDPDHRLGLCKELEERKTGLWASFRLLPLRAQLVREMVSEGHSGLSVGFIDKWPRTLPGGLVERRKCHLDHVALTPEGAYAEAGVTALRELEEPQEHPDSEFWAEHTAWLLNRKQQQA